MTDFYVSAAGNDSNPGTLASPWKTVTRANAAMAFNGGAGLASRVLFRRGDTFPGMLRPYTSLDHTQPGWLRIGAYGDGVKPVISGYKILNTPAGWVQYDADTWSLDFSAGNAGVTYTGYDSAEGHGNGVGFLKVDGVIHGVKRTSLGALVNQWDFYSTGTTLYVRSSANPTSLAGDIRCNVDGDGARIRRATELSDLELVGFGAVGAHIIGGGAHRCRVLRCSISEVGGTASGGDDTRYGNGVQVWSDSTDVHCEHNIVHDCYDAAWTIQGGTNGAASAFTNITWRRNLTYRNTQAEEYFYRGSGAGYVNCVSEYNTHLFPGYGWGEGVRSNPEVAVALLTWSWGDDNAVSADLTMRRNIIYDAKHAFCYNHNSWDPVGMASDRNVIYLRSGTKMRHQDADTISDAAEWAAEMWGGREQATAFGILLGGPTTIDDAAVDGAISDLDLIPPTGQRFAEKLIPIHAPWRAP